MSRVCVKCGLDREPEGFYRNNRTQCKVCVRAAVRKRRRESEAAREYDRARYKTNPDRRGRQAAVSKAWRKGNPDKYKAQTAVGNAVRDGKLIPRDCEHCGSAEHVHAHHDDYAKPLEVIWLCAKCHHRHHAALRAAEAAHAN